MGRTRGGLAGRDECARACPGQRLRAGRRPGGRAPSRPPSGGRGTTPTIARASRPRALRHFGVGRRHGGAAADERAEHLGRGADEVGEAPGQYVERIRTEAARRQLEETDDTVVAIAARCGFGTAETMRRNFLRRVGISPDQYRKAFA